MAGNWDKGELHHLRMRAEMGTKTRVIATEIESIYGKKFPPEEVARMRTELNLRHEDAGVAAFHAVTQGNGGTSQRQKKSAAISEATLAALRDAAARHGDDVPAFVRQDPPDAGSDFEGAGKANKGASKVKAQKPAAQRPSSYIPSDFENGVADVPFSFAPIPVKYPQKGKTYIHCGLPPVRYKGMSADMAAHYFEYVPRGATDPVSVVVASKKMKELVRELADPETIKAAVAEIRRGGGEPAKIESQGSLLDQARATHDLNFMVAHLRPVSIQDKKSSFEAKTLMRELVAAEYAVVMGRNSAEVHAYISAKSLQNDAPGARARVKRLGLG